MNLSSEFATALLDPGGIARMVFILVVLMVEFHLLKRFIRGQVANMATKQELQDAIDKVTTAVADEISRVTQTIQDLKDQIAKGGTLTEADLDAPVASLNQLAASLSTVDVATDGSVTSQIPGSTDTTGGSTPSGTPTQGA